jgi:hypothetical protein
MSTINAFPAYGRVYKTDAELLKDWNDGKDFRLHGNQYINIQDVESLKKIGVTTISVRFSLLGGNRTYDIYL